MRKQGSHYFENTEFWRWCKHSKSTAVWISVFFCLCVVLFTTPTFAAEARYANPKVGDNALDLCRTWGNSCGKPAADAFCQKKGYRRALRFRVRENSPPTTVIGDGRVCTHNECDRIVSLVCEADAVFRNPQVIGTALDFCAKWAEACGKPAADAYCRSRGYQEAVDFAVRQDSPPTRIISSGQVCHEPTCDRIVSIACKGQKQKNGEGIRGKFDAGGEIMTAPPEASEFADFEF